MKKSPAKEVEVDLGEAGILVLQAPKVLTPKERAHTQQILEQVAAAPGRQTIVLQAGWKHAVIKRPAPKPAQQAGCKKRLAPDQYWSFCGDFEFMADPALCTECGGPYALAREQ